MSFTRSLTAWAGPVFAGAALILAAPMPTSAAGDVSKEIAAAEQHAGFAAKSADLKTAQAHLHHTVNCLVGPKGKGFDASQLNPCKDLGDGVMPDFKGDKAKRATLQKALNTARAGLKDKTLKSAQGRAAAADELLKKAM